MKKNFALFFLLIIPFALKAQWFGDGLTPATAYYGLINSSSSMGTWNTLNYPGGIIYVGRSTTGQEDLEVGTGGTLAIEQGITIRFCTALSDLLITGTGALNANSGISNGIIFTRNLQASWGHISFQSMGAAATSTINNCIIEYGNVSTAPGVDNPFHYGGAIHADFSNLIISNCEIRNNRAGWGGGIFVGDGKNPNITNCYIHDNVATTSGGGVYFWRNSNALLSNSILINNNCTGAGGGGGIFLGGAAKAVKIINCTISNNSANNQSLGHNIKIFTNTATPRPQISNSIIWNPANSIVYVTSTPNPADFVNCAIQNPISNSTTLCITLNSSNEGTNPDGPYFSSMSGNDWQLQFRSPCRDEGTSTGAPSTDYLGHYRINLIDIGAFEVQYSRWTGGVGTEWTNATNWEASIVPVSGNSDVIIPFLAGATPNYPIWSPAPDFTIGAGKIMVLDPGAEATFGTLTNNGTLRLESEVSAISSLICNSFSGNNADIQLFLSGGGGQGTYAWHYISSPVTSLSASVFSAVTLDFARYDESLVTTDQSFGWVAYDGWIYLPTPGHLGGNGFSNLDIGHGYNHYFRNNYTYSFSGSFNTGNVTIPLVYNSANSTPDYPDIQGYNLLGNPFTSSLDWNQIDDGLDPAISHAIYFNRLGQFAIWLNGVSINGGTPFIPPMQGFFVKTTAAGKSVTLPSSARVHNADQIRYKKGMEIIPLVRLKIEDTINTDEAVVRFDAAATSGIDKDFDAYKFSKNGGKIDIWSTSGDKDLSINGLPFPDSTIEIPVAFYSATAANIKITGIQIDGLDDYSVILKDKTNGTEINLKTIPMLAFDAPGGIVTNRFVLKIGTIATAVPENIINNKPFNIFAIDGFINIQTLGDDWMGKSGNIKVFDLTGRVMTIKNNTAFSKDDLIRIPANASNGVYIVEIRSGFSRYVGKVMLR